MIKKSKHIEPKYVGVARDRERFDARLTITRKLHRSVAVNSAESAARLYDKMRLELLPREEAVKKLNFPKSIKKTLAFEPSNEDLLPRKKTTGYHGVSWDSNHEKYFVAVSFKKKSYFVGRFSDPEEAARAYDTKNYELKGDKARLNFPELLNKKKTTKAKPKPKRKKKKYIEKISA